MYIEYGKIKPGICYKNVLRLRSQVASHPIPSTILHFYPLSINKSSKGRGKDNHRTKVSEGNKGEVEKILIDLKLGDNFQINDCLA